jgi:lipoate-protein ligase A
MAIVCRLLPYRSADGPANMALDEALLNTMADEPASAVFRTYGWSEPTLSLGYFQALAEAEADPRWHSAPLVRRPTGGGAIWHHHELTYAIIISKSHPLARRAADLYRSVHQAIASVLGGLGVATERRGTGKMQIQLSRPFLCFTDRDPEDIVSHGKKLVGSAQRRRAGAVLQHGSILLSKSPQTPELTGFDDLAGFSLDVLEWSSRVSDAVLTALELRDLASEPTEAEIEQALLLEQRVYRDAAWTHRR